MLIGAHLDSWHAGTGAADNADGVAVAMEAMRILGALGARPRRTIRIALWGGEEQRMHHTNMDVHDRVREADLKQSAIVLASFAWHAALRADRIPRVTR